MMSFIHRGSKIRIYEDSGGKKVDGIAGCLTA